MRDIDDLCDQCATLEGRHAAAKEHGLSPRQEPLHFHHDGCPACSLAADGHLGAPSGEAWPGSVEACTAR